MILKPQTIQENCTRLFLKAQVKLLSIYKKKKAICGEGGLDKRKKKKLSQLYTANATLVIISGTV